MRIKVTSLMIWQSFDSDSLDAKHHFAAILELVMDKGLRLGVIMTEFNI
uniref:Uncharacterized protein MANES_13G154900 n=1 Tax=Rhizophora mucronata TaxID=61149 RepID=A0A2P2MS86_RHIMU